jgi:flagellar biosynthesis activator protein FlaF
MTAEHYRQAQISTGEPRQREYQLFAEITRDLLAASDLGSLDERQNLIRVLSRNRRLWQVLALDCSDNNNELPDETRAGIISLAMWVERHSRAIINEQGDIEALVNVNTTIMEGLAI